MDWVALISIRTTAMVPATADSMDLAIARIAEVVNKDQVHRRDLATRKAEVIKEEAD